MPTHSPQEIATMLSEHANEFPISGSLDAQGDFIQQLVYLLEAFLSASVQETPYLSATVAQAVKELSESPMLTEISTLSNWRSRDADTYIPKKIT